jgi:hypothetical protein
MHKYRSTDTHAHIQINWSIVGSLLGTGVVSFAIVATIAVYRKRCWRWKGIPEDNADVQSTVSTEHAHPQSNTMPELHIDVGVTDGREQDDDGQNHDDARGEDSGGGVMPRRDPNQQSPEYIMHSPPRRDVANAILCYPHAVEVEPSAPPARTGSSDSCSSAEEWETYDSSTQPTSCAANSNGPAVVVADVLPSFAPITRTSSQEDSSGEMMAYRQLLYPSAVPPGDDWQSDNLLSEDFDR